MQNTHLEYVVMSVICKWNFVNLECVPLSNRWRCATLSIIYLPSFVYSSLKDVVNTADYIRLYFPFVIDT
jgi:hypothetical protein